MSMANSNVSGIPLSQEQQIPAEPETETRERIRWGRIAKLPAIFLLLMTLFGLAVAGHTHYVEKESDRLIAYTDQLVAGAVEEGSTADATGSYR